MSSTHIPNVVVYLKCDKELYHYGENIGVHYEVTNYSSTHPIYVVKDLQYISPQPGNRIEIGFAIPKYDNDSLSYYQFMRPSLAEVKPEDTRMMDITINMPLRNTEITSNDELVFKDANIVGDVFVYLVLGFGLDMQFSREGNPLQVFQNWENLIKSNEYRIHILDRGSGTGGKLTDNHRPGDSPKHKPGDPPGPLVTYEMVQQQQVA